MAVCVLAAGVETLVSDFNALQRETKVSEANVAVGSHGVSMMEASPFSIPSKKLVMWLFIISDAVTFGAFLFGYGYLKNATPNWPFRKR